MSTIPIPFNISTFHQSTWESIQGATERESIGSLPNRIWDMIADWFSGTDRAEAKKHLFDLFHLSLDNPAIVKSHDRLKALVSTDRKNLFSTEVKSGIIYSTIDLGKGFSKISIPRTTHEDVLKKILMVADSDISEAQTIMSDLYSEKTEPWEKVAKFMALEKLSGASSQQMFKIDIDDEKALETYSIKFGRDNDFKNFSIERGTIKKNSDFLIDNIPFFTADTRTDAKSHLDKLYSANSTDIEKIKSFSTLKDLSKDNFKDHFEITSELHPSTNSILTTWTIKLALHGQVDNFSISLNQGQCNKDDLIANIRNNIIILSRNEGQYKLTDNQSYTYDNAPIAAESLKSIAKYKKFLSEKDVTPEQMSILLGIFNKTLASIALNSEFKQAGNTITRDIPRCPEQMIPHTNHSMNKLPDGTILYQFNRTTDIALIRDKLDIEAALEALKNDNDLCTSSALAITLHIRTNGKLDIIRAEHMSRK